MTLDPIRALHIIIGMVHEQVDDDEFLGNIYMIAHQAASPDCSKNHPTWTDLALETERQLVEAKIIPPWPLTKTPLEDILILP